MKSLVVIIIMALAVGGTSIVIAAVGYASIMALGRNPSSAPKIMLAMIVALIFAEAIAVISAGFIFALASPCPSVYAHGDGFCCVCGLWSLLVCVGVVVLAWGGVACTGVSLDSLF